MTEFINIARRLSVSAQAAPFQRAVAFPAGRDRAGRVAWSQLTFRQLDQESDRLARGLIQMGVRPGARLVLMVRPSLEFIALTFALFKAGAVIVLIDPGMGRTNIFNCLEEVEPEGFVAIPLVQWMRRLMFRRFRHARLNVAVGGRFSGGMTYRKLLGGDWSPLEMVNTRASDPAAIIFTSGSTGPPKGVLYEHGMFDAQVDLLRERYRIQPGEVDLPGFPLFALFNAAMQVTTVIPDMDPTRPARVDPKKILEAINDNGVTQAFGSPALWNRVGRYCEEHAIRFDSLRRILSAGAPVPTHVLRRLLPALPDEQADVYTPYGATESLPVASINGRQVLAETSEKTRRGAGTCVGALFPRMQLKIIEISSRPIADIRDVTELPPGEIGEIIVRGPVVTREYYRRPEATALAKIPDGDGFWHRMGDVGYQDDQGRLWFCGRKAHIVDAAAGRLFSVRCEAIFNEHPRIYRSALVGLGEKPDQRPVIVAEPEAGQFPRTAADRETLLRELLALGQASDLTRGIRTILLHPGLPVDTRHNVKINREALAPWAAAELARSGG